jgi:hypothetical protein
MKVGEFTGGADIRVLYDTPGGLQQPVDSSKVFITLGFANYQGKDCRARYGSIVSATLGRGLLMKEFTTSQRKMYYFGSESSTAAFHLFSTDTHLTAIRGVVGVSSDTRLGVTYVGDSDRSNPDAPPWGYAVDLTTNIRRLGMVGYGEYARLEGKGFGLATGVDLKRGLVELRHEVQHSSHNFVPSYYDQYYEVQPADLSAVGSRTAFVTEATFRPISDLVGIGRLQKSTDELPSLHLEVAGQVKGLLTGAVTLDVKNYGGSIARTNDTLYQAKLVFSRDRFVDWVLQYSRTYPDETSGSHAPVEYTLLVARLKGG